MKALINIIAGTLLILLGAFIATAYINNKYELYDSVLPYIESTTQLGYVRGIVESKDMVMVRVPDSLRKGPAYDMGFTGDMRLVNYVNAYLITLRHYINTNQQALMTIYVDSTSYDMYQIGDEINVRIQTSQSR